MEESAAHADNLKKEFQVNFTAQKQRVESLAAKTDGLFLQQGGMVSDLLRRISVIENNGLPKIMPCCLQPDRAHISTALLNPHTAVHRPLSPIAPSIPLPQHPTIRTSGGLCTSWPTRRARAPLQYFLLTVLQPREGRYGNGLW